MQIVWFKRDLRVQDNRALARAAMRGPVLPLYVVEPELWTQPDMSARQWAFIEESLVELATDLAQLGQPLIIRTGDTCDVLAELARTFGITDLWSHEETGNDWTFRRDKRVAQWCRANGVQWHEVQNHGVQRKLTSRNGWADAWDRFMSEPVETANALEPITNDPTVIPHLTLAPDPCPERQIGGRSNGLERLQSFLTQRGEHYRREMSSPLAGATSCSRISPHLAWGTLSMREVTQTTWQRQRDLKASPTPTGGWRKSMTSFNGRLHWHCHFIQKLEDDPKVEFENFHPAYNGIRPSEPDQTRLAAWETGETGLPFLDACMRCLRATGWLNFRMRAMVMATASYHLWLHWRDPGLALARMFTDYEPGIHWSQVQMQSGTTGINTVRIYNPVKQGYDQDPTGAFTRRWVPELAHLSDKILQEPWLSDDAGQILGRSYPEPIIDHKEAAKAARVKIWAVRKGDGFRATADHIQNKHGSRKSGVRNRGVRPKKKSATEGAQLSFGFD